MADALTRLAITNAESVNIFEIVIRGLRVTFPHFTHRY